jgi:hypothetical protein
MMALIPTYEVTVKLSRDKDDPSGAARWVQWRVSEDDLSSFLSVLSFNNIPEYGVKREDSGE